MRVGDGARDIEAKPQPAAAFPVAPLEGLEQLLTHLLGQGLALVGDTDSDALRIRHRPNRDGGARAAMLHGV